MAIPTNRLKDIAFSTQFNYGKVGIRSHIDFNINTFESKTITISHGLGYRPFFRLWIQVPGSPRIYLMESGPTTFGNAPNMQIEGIGSDNTNIYVAFGNYGGPLVNGRVYYRIYEDPQ
jgi:hypothetical protein